MAWVVFIVFAKLALIELMEFLQAQRAGLPLPDMTKESIFTYISFSSYPIAGLALVLAIIALCKGQEKVKAIAALVLGSSLFLFFNKIYTLLWDI